jgi:ubiquinone/menaquinone biosynthesis C-methylase UbiE
MAFQRIYWLKKFDWAHYARLYNQYFRSKNNYYIQSAEHLVNSVKLRYSSKVVDLACGTGALTTVLLKNYPPIRIFAVDLSGEMVKYYQKNFKKEIRDRQVTVHEGNAEKINKLTKEKYDAVFISSALWDMEIETLFKNLSKILNKNGQVVFNLPALVVGEEKGFIFFIEHFFRQSLNSQMIYRRIKLKYLKNIFKIYGFKIIKIRAYSFKMSKKNVSQFFNLLKYRYLFILFPNNISYKQRLRECTAIFNDALRYIPRDGISEDGFVFVAKKL